MSSDLAMAVKARAMFGERLKEADYMNLLQKKSVGDIASALKHDPRFQGTLDGINEKSIHRGQLEALLRMNIFYRLKKLTRYTSKDDDRFIYIAIMNSEIEMILSCIRWFMNQDEDMRSDMIVRMPIYIQQHLSFDVRKLSEVNDFADLCEVLAGTRYEKVIRKYQNETLDEHEYIAIAHELRISYYDTVLELVNRYTSGVAREQMTEITLARVELDNIVLIYRLKKYFHTDAEKLQNMICHRYCRFSEKEMNDLMKDCSADEIIERLQKKYHKFTKDVRFTDIEHYTSMIRYKMNYHFMEYYTEPNLVLLSYLLLSETEIMNIINIIEGVRYKVSTDRVKALLVY